MKKFTKVLTIAMIAVLVLALVACAKNDTEKRVADIKDNYKNAGYTVASINKNNDLIKDKENYMTDVEEIYTITKAADSGSGETYVLFVFKDTTKAEALKFAYGNNPKTAISERVLLVGLSGVNTKPFEDAYKDVALS